MLMPVSKEAPHVYALYSVPQLYWEYMYVLMTCITYLFTHHE